MFGDDTNEEWFIDSIKRYKELIMFDTGDPVLQIDLINQNSICMLTEPQPESKAISILSLPTKIIASEEVPISQQNYDLKIKSGIFPKANPKKMLAVYGRNKLITSQENNNGITLYDSNPDAEHLISVNKLNYSIECPDMALLEADKVVLTKDTDVACFIGDLYEEKVLNKFNFKSAKRDHIQPICLNKSTIGLTLKTKGNTAIYDIRSDKAIGLISCESSSSTSWVSSSNYLFYGDQNLLSDIYFLSKAGDIIVYDLRNMDNPIIKHKLLLSTDRDNLQINCSPGNSDIVSISGYDDCVYIYNTRNEIRKIFIHDGHPKTENCAKETYVPCHFWYNSEYIVSCALNNSINCWVPNYNSG